MVYDGKSGKLTEVGSPTSPFINLFPTGKGPIGIAIGSANKKFALVANNGNHPIDDSLAWAPLARAVPRA